MHRLYFSSYLYILKALIDESPGIKNYLLKRKNNVAPGTMEAIPWKRKYKNREISNVAYGVCKRNWKYLTDKQQEFA